MAFFSINGLFLVLITGLFRAITAGELLDKMTQNYARSDSLRSPKVVESAVSK